jgi:hypothetical protein
VIATLVVPSCRETALQDFLAAWYPFPWDRTYVVWDGENKPKLDYDLVIYNWKDLDLAEQKCGRNIFARRDASIRCYGLLMAYKAGADVILTLDDDCYPTESYHNYFVAQHIKNISHAPAYASSIPGLRVRGQPYNMNYTENAAVAVSMGLWSTIPDIDGIQSVASEQRGDFIPPHDIRIMSDKQLFSVCSMNLAFRRDITPAMYFPFMGPKSPYCRFDDIWSGLCLQKALTATGESIAVGAPIVKHVRLSDSMVNLQKECTGLHMNEWLWQRFAKMQVPVGKIEDAMYFIANEISRLSADSPNPDYMLRWSKDMLTWLELCRDVD